MISLKLSFSVLYTSTFTHLTAVSLTLHVDQAEFPHPPPANICQFGLESNDFYYCSGNIENFPHLESLRHVRGAAITAGSLHFGQILAHNSILHANPEEEDGDLE